MTGGIQESEITGGNSKVNEYTNDLYYPKSILEFSIANLRKIVYIQLKSQLIYLNI